MASTTRQPLTIAFVVPPENGQSNIHLAVLHHLLSLTPSEVPPLRLHLLSDEPLRKRINLPSSDYHTFTFHPIREDSIYQRYLVDTDSRQHGASQAVRHPPVSLTQQKCYWLLRDFMTGKKDQFFAYYDYVTEIFGKIQPDLAVLDILCTYAHDACRKMGITYGVLCPQSSMDLSRMKQPGMAGLWKYPAFASALPYPLSLLQIGLNIWLNIVLIYIFASDPTVRDLEGARRKAGAKGNVLMPYTDDLPFLIVPSVPEMEYPHIPQSNTVFAGPLLLDVPTVSTSYYAELSTFLDGGRTIYVNMGSLFRYTDTDVDNMLSGIVEGRKRATGQGEIRVLWKLPNKNAFATILEKYLVDEEVKRAIKIEEWIEPAVLSVLKHPNVVAAIHHGGANSLAEAALAGVPQIILPQWWDLYDFAVRVEVMGHGLYGNRSAPAGILASDLANAVERVLSDQEGEEGWKMKLKSVEFAKACQEAGGLRKAAEVIIGTALASQGDR